MKRRHPVVSLSAAIGLIAVPLLLFAGTSVAHAGGNTTYSPGTPALDTVTNGPWTLSQGDPAAGAPYNQSLPTYTPGGSPTQSGGSPNLAVYPASTAPPGPPYATGTAGTPGPVPAYCSSGGPAPESGTQAAEPANTTLPMSPYYFPFVTQTPGDATQGHLTGYFDWRPKDTEEALVVARSTDGGKSWSFVSKVLEQNPESYCPTGDTNDNGQGHTFVMSVGGSSHLYTLQRPAGDNVGVGLLVNPVTPSAANPVAGLPAVESVGTDPDTFAVGTSEVPSVGSGGSIPVTSLGSGAEAFPPGGFIDTNPNVASGTIFSCTATSGTTLTGCTTGGAAAATISGGDELLSVLGTATAAVTIPQGPNTTAETGGASLSLSASLSTTSAANVPGRFYVDGATIYCVNINSTNNQLQNCTTTHSGGVSVAVGNPVTTDPIVPSGGQQTSGLVAPDGIVGVVPSSLAAVGYPAAPAGATVIIYGEKILSYYIEGTVATAVTLPAATITMTPSATPTAPIPASGSFQIYLGTSGGIQTVTCTGFSTGATDTFSGCSGGTGSVAAGNDVGGPGAAIASSATLGAIGEGSTKPKTLFKNNEDYTVLRAAYTTDGVNFSDLGVISGTSNGASGYTDVNNPSAQAFPSTIDLAQGATDTPELRYVGTRGTIITNPDGSIGMFDSGAWQSDGDSDAFNQIFYTSSTDGAHWSEPVVIESTDYTFSARQQQDTALAGGTDAPLGIGGYFAGRAYGPTVVQNPDQSLTLVFAGYSTPKPIPLAGAVLGDQQGGAPQWVIQPDDPTLYRSILTMTLTPNSTPVVPEAPLAIFLPVTGALLLVGWWLARGARRRRAGMID